MPSIKEIYNSIGEVELNADSINLNVDGLEALASTQQADIALIKADVDDIRADLANGVTINQPVAITDNGGTLTVDGTVTANVSDGTIFSVGSVRDGDGNTFGIDRDFPISGTVTANAGTDLNTSALALESTATSIKTAVEILDNAISGNEMQVDIVSSAAIPVTDNGGSLTVDGSVSVSNFPATQPVSGTVTANAGTGTFAVSDRGATGETSISTFTSTSSATLKSSNANRKLLTIFNQGAGNLHVLYGSGTASTTNYSVRLSSGAYLEIEKYTGQVNAIFATAGTARVTEIT